MLRSIALPLAFLVTLAPGAPPPQKPATLEVRPERLELQVGESAQIEVVVRNEDGAVVPEAPVLYLPVRGQFWNLELGTWSFNLFELSGDGRVTASRPGEYAVLVRVPSGDGFLEREIPLSIRRPPVTTVEVEYAGPFYAGTEVEFSAVARDATGARRDDVSVTWESSDPAVVEPGATGWVRLRRPGSATLTAAAGEGRLEILIEVMPDPVEILRLEVDAARVRTGDVVQLRPIALGPDGAPVTPPALTYTVAGRTGDWTPGGATNALITQDGRFVADVPGEYVLVATSGSHTARALVTAGPRDVRRRVELVGHGRVSDRATSDLWVWEGLDGHDYAITGTHSAQGHAYVWDVTDPSAMVIVDTVQVDARTVNDVKVSDDGRVAVISREGASNRRNGIVLLDVSAPREGVRILSRFDDELTGGVHNVFVYEDHVYALSAGQRYDIIDIEDPANPRRVGRFALPEEDRSIHDVWVVDGIAYSANWNHGVVMVDVGGGGMGGSPRQPVLMERFPFPSGWNHAVYPFRSRSTGKHYVIAGDEAARTGRFSPEPEIGTGTPGYDGEPPRWRGWIHILEWEPGSGRAPELVARYEVPEAGSHNIWVEDDVMYVAFYNGGLRVVDLSGELLGDLYRQGREIAHFLPLDPRGFVPNAAQVWGAQPFKGNVFFSDYHSGLWAVRLVDPE